MELNEKKASQSTIDLQKFLNIFCEQKFIVTMIIAICTIIAIVVAFVLPKSYQSTSLIQIKTTPITPITAIANAIDVNYSGKNSENATSSDSYILLIQTSEVLKPIINKMDLSEETKEQMTSASFAKSYLEISGIRNTNFISITAYGKTPEESYMIAKSIPESLSNLLTKLNKESNTENLKFLEEQITTAKQDMEEKENKLSTYQQEKKIYAPDEQTKAIIDNLNGYDNAIAQLQADLDGNTAKLNGVAVQLEQQNTDLLKYQVSDNPNISNLREAIVNKRVELVGLQQRYTEQHPDMVRAKEELMSLESSLSNEITSAINSQSVSLSPVQSGLLQQKLDAETKIAIDNASLDVLKSKQNDTENLIANLNVDSIEYTRLAREAKIAGNVYTALVENYQQTKVQEAKLSMDIQVVDPAQLPKEDMPAKPNKRLIILIGFLIGLIGAFGYSIYVYKKEYSI